jgi:hypothetical protein
LNTQSVRSRRRGAVLPIVAISLIALFGFLALSVDLGMVAVAKSQAQHAADSAALTAVRSVDGSPSPNLAQATTNGQTVAANNPVLTSAVQASQLGLEYGSYHYDVSSSLFVPQYPPVAPDNYNLAKATVTLPVNTAFARILGITTTNVSATAVAAHRPRDVSVILDYSGSMNNESDIWNVESYLSTANQNTPNNADPNFPRFGHYSNVSAANLQSTSTDPQVGKCNITQAALGVPAMVNDYYQSARGATTPLPAFTPLPNSYTTAPAGDDTLTTTKNTTTTYAKTVQDVTGGTTKDATFETTSYRTVAKPFTGYTAGPNYWGKTFFVWPPDPLAVNDWRRKFFLKTGGTWPTFGGPVDDNTLLWQTVNPPPSNQPNYHFPTEVTGDASPGTKHYVVNYAAILAWIKNVGPAVFPPQLRAGNILFYDSIPDDVPQGAYNHSQLNSAIDVPTVRFWKEYIDWTLGVWVDPFGVHQEVASPTCSIGPDFLWGTFKVSAKPTGVGAPYMNYQDNPLRPRHRMWFGPMTMIQFMMDTGIFPGTARDISLYPAKLGLMGAIQDIQLNHPNDLVSLIMFGRPQFTNDPANIGTFDNAQFSLSRNYTGMINGLWYPPNSGTTDVRPWDLNARQTPSAHGDFCSNTTLKQGFMLAYNQLSGNSTVSSTVAGGQPVGGLGRKGAKRLVICEIDGMANYDSRPTGAFQNNGADKSYYPILPGNPITGGGYDQNSLLQVVQAIANNPDGTAGNPPFTPPSGVTMPSNLGYPGYSTLRKPMAIHTLAFGVVYEPGATGSQATNSVALLQAISGLGGTIFPGSPGDPDNGYKWCTGTLAQRQAKLQQAFENVMDDGASVSLVQ